MSVSESVSLSMSMSVSLSMSVSVSFQRVPTSPMESLMELMSSCDPYVAPPWPDIPHTDK